MKSTSRWVFRVVVIGIVAAVLFFVLRPKPVPIQSTRIDRGPLRVTVDEEGKTRARDTFLLSAPVTGQLERVSLRQGDTVAQGMVVARLRPVPLDERGRVQAEASLEAAKDAKQVATARLQQATAALDQAHRTRARLQDLVSRNLSAHERLEEAQLAQTLAEREVEAARFAVRVADHEMESARAALLWAQQGQADSLSGRIEVRSPVAGRVLRVHLQSEQIVAAGAPILELGDTRALEIVIDVLTEDALRMRPGDVMLVEAGGDLGTLRARVRTIEPSAFTKVSALGVEEQRVHVIGDLLSIPASLGDGYRVETSIIVWERAHVLSVPTSALFHRGSRWAVYVIEGGRARSREVAIGHRSADRAEVLGGLSEGVPVILYPGDRIRDGVAVRETAQP
jgi:HlyD family secretion protein